MFDQSNGTTPEFSCLGSELGSLWRVEWTNALAGARQLPGLASNRPARYGEETRTFQRRCVCLGEIMFLQPGAGAMRIPVPVLFGSILLTLSACDAPSIHIPDDAAVPPVSRASVSTDCPSGYDCIPAELLGGVPAFLDTIGTSCAQEACGKNGGTPVSIVEDVQGTFLDLITYSCAAGGSGTRLSNEPCWDCTADCGPVNCPPGKQCTSVTIYGQPGSDCQAYACNASDGWAVYTTASFQPPQCIRARGFPPSPPSTNASIIGGHVHLSWGSVTGATSYRVYRQLEWQSAPEVWYTTSATFYNDGTTEVTGILQGQPSSGKWVSYHVVSVNAVGESGYLLKHYFSYSGTAPY